MESNPWNWTFKRVNVGEWQGRERWTNLVEHIQHLFLLFFSLTSLACLDLHQYWSRMSIMTEKTCSFFAFSWWWYILASAKVHMGAALRSQVLTAHSQEIYSREIEAVRKGDEWMSYIYKLTHWSATDGAIHSTHTLDESPSLFNLIESVKA